MSTERWDRIEALFHDALDVPPDGRGAWLETACDDPGIRDEVARLLASDAESEGGAFIDRAVQDAVLGMSDPGTLAGRRFGPWRLIREAGRGGMGSVWLAERADDSYSAQVAIKLVHGAFLSPALARRFRAERQILADLEHPNIARLVDGGAGPDGTPFLAMEFVPGVPVTEYAWSHGLDLESRLRLFLTICGAVQHAHRSLVVHRDLKPSNILVDPDGVPKLVDFGIAKLVDEAGGDATTGLERPMTPAYASPEQIRGERITVASDVFSLGTVLYELLTGEHPFRDSDATAEEVRHRILELDPLPPSAAAARSADVTKFVPPRSLLGDLDNVLLEALRKEPERRYSTVEQFADDVRSYLEGRPVRARPATLGYRARKFVRRNRTGVIAAGLAAALLATTVTFYTVRLTTERDVAERERATAERVTAFMTDMFRDADPARSLGASLTVRDALDRGRAQLADELVDEPEVRARLLTAIGVTYGSLAAFETADSVLQEALSLAEELDGGQGALSALVLGQLTELELDRSDVATARGYARRALAIDETLGDPIRLSASLSRMGSTLIDTSRDSAVQMLERSLDLREAAVGPMDATVARLHYLIAITRLRAGDHEAALEELRHALSVQDSVLPPLHAARSATLNVMAITYAGLEKHDSAKVLYEEALEARIRVFGPDHPEAAQALNNLSTAMQALDQGDSAVALLDRALEIRTAYFGEEHRDVANSLMTMGNALGGMGEPEEAVPYMERAIEIYRRVLPTDHRDIYFPLYNLGVVLNRVDRHAEAEPYLRDALRIAEVSLESDGRSAAITRQALGNSVKAIGDTAQAIALYVESLAGLEAALGPEHPWILYPVESLAETRLDLGDYADAVELYEAWLPLLERTYASDPASLATALTHYATSLRGVGREADAEAFESRAVALTEAAPSLP